MEVIQIWTEIIRDKMVETFGGIAVSEIKDSTEKPICSFEYTVPEKNWRDWFDFPIDKDDVDEEAPLI